MRHPTTTKPRRRANRRPTIASLAAFAWISLAWAASSGSLVHAQDDIDLEPPLIEHEPVDTGVPGREQEFEATVVDDRELAEVLLFHRFAGDTSFEETPMRQIASSSVYAATVTTPPGETRAIEYYIQARDEAGNRVIRGYAFSPLVRSLGGAPGPGANAEAVDEPVAQAGGGRRWLYIGLGVLAAGALAASLGDDGSSSEAGPNTFTLTIDPPQ